MKRFLAIVVLGVLLSVDVAQAQYIGRIAENPVTGHTYYSIRDADGWSGVYWPVADYYARNLGGHLATINDAAENAWITRAFPGEPYLWIGLNDVEQEGRFAWSSGQSVTYTNWAPGEPNNYGGNEDYVRMRNYTGAQSKWNDLGLTTQDDPNWPIWGLVEVPTQPSNTRVIMTALNPANWHTYKLIGSDGGSGGVSWYKAEMAAKQLGGHLVTINNQKENDWVVSKFGSHSNLWIGLSDPDHDGQFTWSSGAPVTYTNWEPGEPNNYFDNEGFAHVDARVTGGVWNDTSGDLSYMLDHNAFGVVEVAYDAPQFLFRDSGDDMPWIDHVGFYPGGNQKVWEAHLWGYATGVYVDPDTDQGVSVDRASGVQQQHTLASFYENRLTSSGGSSPTVAEHSTSVAISQSDADQINDWIIENAQGAGYIIGSANLQKGYYLNRYSCVGLLERAAEEVGVHSGQGYIPNSMEGLSIRDKNVFSPSLLYYCLVYPEVWDENYLVGQVDPVDFILTDPLGRRLGHVQGTVFDEIPNADLVVEDEDYEWFLIPERVPGVYRVDFFGLGEEYAAQFDLMDPVHGLTTWQYSGYLAEGELFSVSLVPEPTTFVLFVLGALSLLAWRRRRR
ncbi:MAG: lectin-like protein [Candidatus Andersenbacteria bacterium]|nr:lectin-like protein [bacterium]MDZ4225517.1 lectin-like protein [Candidatus Andersenbacteria bacterium]